LLLRQTVFSRATITFLDEAPCIDKVLESKLESARLRFWRQRLKDFSQTCTFGAIPDGGQDR
jgi:hypothetical protein